MNKKDTEKTKNETYFQPTFGNRPESIIGRESEIADFMSGLREPIGSRNRSTLIIGQRGMGKTALLLELSDRARKENFVVARVTAHDRMSDVIIEQVQLNGSQYFNDEKRKVTGISAGALGFSFGLTFSDAAEKQYGFRSKMSLLCDKLAEKGKGILILVDEAGPSKAMREVAASYQELIGDEKNVAMGMAGLPHSISGVLNDEVLTFMNRANKVELKEISISAIYAYYERVFSAMGYKYEDETLETAAEKTKGFPYLMQLMGYYIVQFARGNGIIDKKILNKSEKAALRDLENNVFEPILAPLSDNDRIFLTSMAHFGDIVSVNKLKEYMGDKGPAIQPYRKRLIDAGVIEATRRGELTFAVPYLSEHIAKTTE